MWFPNGFGVTITVWLSYTVPLLNTVLWSRLYLVPRRVIGAFYRISLHFTVLRSLLGAFSCRRWLTVNLMAELEKKSDSFGNSFTSLEKKTVRGSLLQSSCSFYIPFHLGKGLQAYTGCPKKIALLEFHENKFIGYFRPRTRISASSRNSSLLSRTNWTHNRSMWS